MIHLFDIAKSYPTSEGVHAVIKPTRLSLPSHRRIGVLGQNGAGKSTLLNLIAGVENPDQGYIQRDCRISWPLGFSGALHNDLTGAENAAFVARIYGVDVDYTMDFVEDFSEIGEYFCEPMRSYSSGMRARLAFGLSMAIDFECYLIDEITGVGDLSFQAKCRQAFAERTEKSGILMVSHNENTIKSYCDVAIVIVNGHLIPFEDIDEAVEFYGTVV